MVTSGLNASGASLAVCSATGCSLIAGMTFPLFSFKATHAAVALAEVSVWRTFNLLHPPSKRFIWEAFGKFAPVCTSGSETAKPFVFT